MADASGSTDAGGGRRRPTLWRLVTETVRGCFRYRVTGLAAEAGFFALLSLPPLILGFAGAIGYLSQWIGQINTGRLQERIIELARTFLTEQSVEQTIVPTLRDVFSGPRLDLISLGFVLSLWSGSRALNVYVDTISIMYGLGGRRGIIRTRALSFSLYVVGLVLGSLAVPLVLLGPDIVARALPERVHWLNGLYWPLVVFLTVAFLTTLYDVSVPARTPWVRGVPGAALAFTIWVGGSFVLRWVLSRSVGGTSIYGPLASPIIVLIWLYMLAIAVLIGAALNAAVDVVWPRRETSEARGAVAARAAAMARRAGGGVPPVLPRPALTPMPAQAAAPVTAVPVSAPPPGSRPDIPVTAPGDRG